MRPFKQIALWFTAIQSAAAVTCPTLRPAYPAPIAKEGWTATLVAQQITEARGILFDKNDNLLVIEQNKGIVHLEFDDGDGSCLELKKKTTLINSSGVRYSCSKHSLEFQLITSL